MTGEGQVDATSLEGKVPAAVVAAARRAAVPSVVFGGVVTAEAEALYAAGATALLPLSGAVEHAERDLGRLGFALGRLAEALRG